MEKILQENKLSKHLSSFTLSNTFERISYYGIRSSLLMYLTGKTIHMSFSETNELYSWFIFAVLFTPILGGLLGDLKLGHRKTSILGLIINITGTSLLLIPRLSFIYLSLVLLAIGQGLYKPNLTAQVGRLNLNSSKLLDGSFMMIYTSSLIGAFLAPLMLAFIPQGSMYYCFGFFIFTYLVSLLFQIKAKSPSPENNEKITITKTNWKPIWLMATGISIFWVGANFIETSYAKLIAGENNFYSTTLIYFDSFNNLFAIALGILGCFVWVKYFPDSFKKLNFGIIALIIALILFVVFNCTYSSLSPIQFYPVIILSTIAEALLAPLFYSTLVRYSKTKYLAIFCSLTFLPIQLLQLLFDKTRAFLNLNELLMSLTLLIILTLYLVTLKKFQPVPFPNFGEKKVDNTESDAQ
ncbi:MAG: MFS transporter [Bacteroidia bacterium]